MTKEPRRSWHHTQPASSLNKFYRWGAQVGGQEHSTFMPFVDGLRKCIVVVVIQETKETSECIDQFQLGGLPSTDRGSSAQCPFFRYKTACLDMDYIVKRISYLSTKYFAASDGQTCQTTTWMIEISASHIFHLHIGTAIISNDHLSLSIISQASWFLLYEDLLVVSGTEHFTSVL